jgi:hypothetical protein
MENLKQGLPCKRAPESGLRSRNRSGLFPYARQHPRRTAVVGSVEE